LTSCEHPFVASQGPAYTRFRRALDQKNVTEALSAASELGFVGLAEALELTLLLADKEPEKFDRSRALACCFVYDSKNVTLGESLAVLALLAAIPGNRSAAEALAELLSRRGGMERPCETLVGWARET
jgi:hypothetical protein